jgi:hypothetical protein
MSVRKHHKAVKRTKAKKAAKKIKAVKKATSRRSFLPTRRRVKIREKIMDIDVNSATYDGDYALLILFSDGMQKRVDFSPFINSIEAPYLKKYKNTDKFKDFKIEEGNVVWGKDWDLIFPVKQLYSGKIC